MPDTHAGPRQVIDQGETRYTLLGTAHVSRASADEVRELIRSGDFDAVAIELCPTRHQSATQPDAMAKMDLFQVLRQGKAGMVAASLALGAFQQRVAEQSGVTPGAEMQMAIKETQRADLPLYLVDRDIGVTLKRIYHNVPWWQRMSLVSGLLGSVVSRKKVSSEEIERLKEGDVLESTFAEFAEQSESLYAPLIRERDRYMALRLREEVAGQAPRNILVVVGAGHMKGLGKHLQTLGQQPPSAEAIDEERRLLEVTPARSKLWKALPWVIVALVLTGFAIGFSRDSGLGWSLVGEWFLINGALSALGTAIALAHPLTIIATFIAAPLTSLNPTIGAGFVAAGVELAIRRPTVGDFSRLRHDVSTPRGWWKNRVARTLLVFLLATLGSAAGTWIAGLRIAGQLFG
ncbi:TraB/GumN family protein [Chromohalobacter sp. 296-RDG]|uniref:TraB/GumN family protein n=1 Tax=Chromohalobacter sp. 296-RDG TaxID=2994062 RepID=UPI002469C40C|nr:TraB/GumN family protein [Chromohalobacter sp. 296-RDG]